MLWCFKPTSDEPVSCMLWYFEPTSDEPVSCMLWCFEPTRDGCVYSLNNCKLYVVLELTRCVDSLTWVLRL